MMATKDLFLHMVDEATSLYNDLPMNVNRFYIEIMRS
jgi:hypothetical protein